jgi:hypothetical protein
VRQRILILTSYFLRRLFTSLTGIIFLILALIYWALLFPPGQVTPDVAYYILVVGAFGAAMAFLAALTTAARANRAANFPLVVRLPSRVEYLTAVLLCSLIFATVLQSLVAILALIQGPALPMERALEIPPVWLAFNILAVVLAMHASDLVTSSWSRVYVFGLLAILLFGQSAGGTLGRWLAGRISGLGRALISGQWVSGGRALNDFAGWLDGDGAEMLKRVFGFVFWPFHSIADGILTGHFEPVQALAPAIILLYATILFMFASDFFATKDLDFME